MSEFKKTDIKIHHSSGTKQLVVVEELWDTESFEKPSEVQESLLEQLSQVLSLLSQESL